MLFSICAGILLDFFHCMINDHEAEITPGSMIEELCPLQTFYGIGLIILVTIYPLWQYSSTQSFKAVSNCIYGLTL